MATKTWTRVMLALAAALLLLSSGCSTAKRFITVTHWYDADTLYLAYSEDDGGYAAKVLGCHREDNNHLTCTKQEALNTAINGD